jgi:hypothetical protein
VQPDTACEITENARSPCENTEIQARLCILHVSIVTPSVRSQRVGSFCHGLLGGRAAAGEGSFDGSAARLAKRVSEYVREHVKISISPIRPAVPGTVNPDEDFSFNLTVQNETVTTFAGAEMTAGIPIVNVLIALYVGGGSGHLIVPALRNIKEVRSNESDPSSVLSSGSTGPASGYFSCDR